MGIEQAHEVLAVVDRGAGNRIMVHQLVCPVNVDMVLVTEVRVPMPIRPAGILVLLAILHRFALLARIALTVCCHDGRFDDLATLRQVALVLEVAVEHVEQLLHRARLGQRLAVKPERLGIGHRICRAQTHKVHEREPVAHLAFHSLIRQIE